MQKIDLTNPVQGARVTGAILVKGYDVKQTKTGKEYITGTLENQSKIYFKAWSDSIAFSQFKNYDFVNVVAKVDGRFDEYNGVFSIIVENVVAIDGFNDYDFFETRYNIDAYYDALKGYITKKVSDKALKIANDVLFENEKAKEAFRVEFAAKSHHDNCVGGLLAHTYRVVCNVGYLLNQYPNLAVGKNQDEVDLLYIGALVHDIGKLDEMHFGEYSRLGNILGHRYLGINRLNKKMIVENYSEDWYDRLVSIIIQHHGEYGEECKTLVSYVVHKADIMDSDFASIVEALKEPETSNDSQLIKYNGLKLYI